MSPRTSRPLRLRTRAATGQVTTIELFLDLVFVFVITQVTHHIESHPGWEGLLHALLALTVVWWMFLGFSWLTNAVRPDATVIRLLLVLAMMAFFIMGLDLPFAFDTDGLAFPLAYLAAVAIHCLLFLTADRASARTAIIRTVPFNAGAGVLILIAPTFPRPSPGCAGPPQSCSSSSSRPCLGASGASSSNRTTSSNGTDSSSSSCSANPSSPSASAPKEPR